MDRFWSKVDIRGPDECWLWLASTNNKGYGQFRFEGTMRYAHRVAWKLTHGSFPAQHLLHSCDNPLCCNPAHLREGSQAENMADMVAKGRQQRGEGRWNCKLTDAQVAEVRTLYVSGQWTQRELGAWFGVTRPHISCIVNHRQRNKKP